VLSDVSRPAYQPVHATGLLVLADHATASVPGHLSGNATDHAFFVDSAVGNTRANHVVFDTISLADTATFYIVRAITVGHQMVPTLVQPAIAGNSAQTMALVPQPGLY
jgi:hypothetical protein